MNLEYVIITFCGFFVPFAFLSCRRLLVAQKPIYIFHRGIFRARKLSLSLAVMEILSTLGLILVPFFMFGKDALPPVLIWLLPLLWGVAILVWTIIDYRAFGEGVYEGGLLLEDYSYFTEQIMELVSKPDGEEFAHVVLFYKNLDGDRTLSGQFRMKAVYVDRMISVL